MDFAPAYLLERFFYRFGEFFRHWYADGSRYFFRKFRESFRGAYASAALRVWHYLLGVVLAAAYVVWLAVPALLLFHVVRYL